jgi:pancreatic triacylglycerol lipase
MIIHGFAQNGRSTINRDLKNSYLVRNDFNVIVVDWSLVSSPYYQYARYRVDPTGIAIARFIDWMNINLSTLHVLGYDLGAHIAGIAGKNIPRGQIGRIIGLDPSLPLFNVNAVNSRLRAGDAVLVEVFHSNGGQQGIFQSIGDVDFYINNGRVQPECSSSNVLYCSHYRAVVTYSRLLNGQNNYIVIPCESVSQVETGCSQDPIEILLEELNPSGIYQILTVNAEAINLEVEIVGSTEKSEKTTEN